MRECIVTAPTTDLQRSGLSAAPPAPPLVLGEAARSGSDGGYEARIALDAATRADAYALRYRCYLAGGHIAPNQAQSFSDRFDDMPNATTIVVYQAGHAVASVRVCLVRRGPGTASPGREAYPDEVEALLRESGPEGPGFEGVEVNRLVCAPEAANDQSLVFVLYRLAGRLTLAAGSRVGFACVRRNHLPFYRRIHFREVAGPRPYPGLSCPMQLLSSTRAAWDDVRATFKLIDPDAEPDGALEGLEHGKTVRPRLMRRMGGQMSRQKP